MEGKNRKMTQEKKTDKRRRREELRWLLKKKKDGFWDVNCDCCPLKWYLWCWYCFILRFMISYWVAKLLLMMMLMMLLYKIMLLLLMLKSIQLLFLIMVLSYCFASVADVFVGANAYAALNMLNKNLLMLALILLEQHSCGYCWGWRCCW